jgi:nitrate/nitrite-specific signal transduction histidine kinase
MLRRALRKFHFRTIRARLLIGFVLMALFSAVGISLGSVIIGYFNGRQQALDRLESVAALKELEVSVWVGSLQNELLVALNEQYTSERASVVLDLANANKYYLFYFKAMQMRLRRLTEQSQYLQGISLLDLGGQVVLSTDEQQEREDCLGQIFFQRGLEGPYVQLPFPPQGSEGDTLQTTKVDERTCGVIEPEREAVAIVTRPVLDAEGRPLGVIAAQASLEPLTDLLLDPTGLGDTGKTYLADDNNVLLLTGSQIPASAKGLNDRDPRALYTSDSDISVDLRVGDPGVYDDYEDTRVVGVYRFLPDLNLVLAVEQDLDEAFQAIYSNLTLNGSIALIAVFLAAAASYFITRSITGPLVNLVDTATQIAQGDLEQAASVEHDDEVGALANAFNSMTAQLRDLINNLEQRVKERTQDLQVANQALERRALQLETSAKVSREVTSILDIDDLLTQVVLLIRDAFSYYHVHIFLIDHETNRLVLRATTGAQERPPLAMGIGAGSLNGEAAQTGNPLLINDVTKESRFLAHGSLPDTQSELVIPLKIGPDLIGTLDVHSTKKHAFTAEDALVIQSLGDQISIAIENARLYERSRDLAVLEERNRLARDLHDSVIQALYSLSLLAGGWRRLVSSGEEENVLSYFDRVGEISHQALKEMRLLVHELRPTALEQEGLLGALHQRLSAVENRSSIKARLKAEELFELPNHVEEGLYRIAQEALNNALKHAQATEVSVWIRADGDCVALEVTDNGCGFEPEALAVQGGLGLKSMQERAMQLAGTLTITSTPGEGTTVRAVVATDGSRMQPGSE